MQKQQLKLRPKDSEQGYILLQMYEDKLVDLVASSPGLIKDLKTGEVRVYNQIPLDRCTQCAYKFPEKEVEKIKSLKAYEEAKVECVCGTTHIYFKKGFPLNKERVKEFFDKHLK